MPLTKKGKKIMNSMQRTYGARRVKQVFYATRNAGKIEGVEKKAKGGSVGTLGLKRAVKRRAKVELMRLATTLSQA